MAQTDSTDPSQIRQAALGRLARREHSKAELQDKLTRKGFEEQVITNVLTELEQQGLLSDERFTEAYVRYRGNLGFGPRRIEQELRERGVPDHLIAAYLDSSDSHWLDEVRQVRQKRFGAGVPSDYKDRAKQMRYLQYRGFTHEQINGAFRQPE
jgi:regulatory protein